MCVCVCVCVSEAQRRKMCVFVKILQHVTETDHGIEVRVCVCMYVCMAVLLRQTRQRGCMYTHI